MTKIQLRKIVSLTALLSFIIMAWTGVVLYFVPPGRIAYWVVWTFFGLTKTQYGEIHTTFSVLFLITMGLHIWLNWKAIILYLKNKAKKFVFFTKEMIISIVITALFLLGTLYYWLPFGTFLNSLENFKDGYEMLDTAPFGHAELLALDKFCKKLNLNLEKSIQALNNKGIHIKSPKTSLKEIAIENNTSPATIYEIIKNIKNTEEKTKTQPQETTEISGLGRLKISQLAEKINLDLESVIKKLKNKNINVKPDDKVKDVAEKYGLLPMDIYEMIK